MDFNELPPARGLSKSIPSHLEGQVVVVHAADLASSRKLIPDFATWSQCFSLYAAVAMAHEPSRAGDLMAYNNLIATMSKRFPWPSWIIYDQNFREEAAAIPGKPWGKADASLYSQCFTGVITGSAEPWCQVCQSLGHQSGSCPYGPPFKRHRIETKREAPTQLCRKFNNNDGMCSYRGNCKFAHKCFLCGGDHPYSQCTKGRKNRRDGRK